MFQYCSHGSYQSKGVAREGVVLYITKLPVLQNLINQEEMNR